MSKRKKRMIVGVVVHNLSNIVGCVEEKENKLLLQYNNGKKEFVENIHEANKKISDDEFISQVEPYDATKFSPWMLDHV